MPKVVVELLLPPHDDIRIYHFDAQLTDHRGLLLIGLVQSLPGVDSAKYGQKNLIVCLDPLPNWQIEPEIIAAIRQVFNWSEQPEVVHNDPTYVCETRFYRESAELLQANPE